MHNLPRLGRVVIAGMLTAVVGCGTQAAPLSEPANPLPELGCKFDPAETGVLRGRVVWSGALPSEGDSLPAPRLQGMWVEQFRGKNPAWPRIDERSMGVAGAVIFLRKVDAERSKPWDISPPRVVMKDGFIRIKQDGKEGAIGFSRVGDNVAMISHGPSLEMLRAREAAFFTLPFPDAGKSIERTFARTGLVELSSAAGNFWARSWLFVVDHPYIALSDDRGDFVLKDVPEGDYEVICWMPSWRIQRRERDPETMSTARLFFGPPLEKSASVLVRRGETAEVEFRASINDFPVK